MKRTITSLLFCLVATFCMATNDGGDDSAIEIDTLCANHEDKGIYLGGISDGYGDNRIDFTHVIKTRPTVVVTADELYGGYFYQVVGERFYYGMLVSNVKLNGPYRINVISSEGDIIHTQIIDMVPGKQYTLRFSPNLLGTYTITYENNEEVFSAHFLHYNPSGIDEMRNGENENMRNGTVYDISGRRVANSPLGPKGRFQSEAGKEFSIFNSQSKKRGIYIKQGRKIYVNK